MSIEKQEPVAWYHAEDYNTHFTTNPSEDMIGVYWKPLYTAPPQREWVGLATEDIEKIHYDIKCKGMGAYSTDDIYRAIEAKLKEKNNG